MSNGSDVMTLNEICKYLKMSRSKIYRLINAGEIPCKRIGERYRFSRRLLLAWVEGGSTPIPKATAAPSPARDTKPAASQDMSEYIDKFEAAELLNSKPNTITYWAKSGLLPFKLSGKKQMYSRADIDKLRQEKGLL